MKKYIVLLCMAFIAATSYGQHRVLAPQEFESTVKVNGALTATSTFGVTGLSTLGSLTTAKNIYGTLQTISAARDTAKGYPLSVVTASRKDTIVLKTSLYTAGQTFKMLCTASANDSTYIMTSTGNINAASTYWFVGTYKAVTFYFDGTNYWILK